MMGGQIDRSILTFVRSTRAGATALTGVLVTLAAFAGVGFAGDYLVLTGQRDLLKAATNAATVATIKHFADMNLDDGHGGELDDEALDAALRPVATRYILANIPPHKRELASETLELTITPNRTLRTVAITAQADLGGILFLNGLVGSSDFPVGVRSGAIGDHGSSEVVLAIDVTGSMYYTLAGDYPSDLPDYANYPHGQYPFTKMNITKQAAAELVSILNPDGNGAAVGIVPWHFKVRIGPNQRERWISENWARYADERTYPNPYRGAPAGGETTTMPAESSRETWKGCFDQRALAGTPPPALSPALPAAYPFTMSYYTHEIRLSTVGFSCRPKPDQDYCYDPLADAGQVSYRLPPQEGCIQETSADNGSPGYIVPLTTDQQFLHRYIDRLSEGGSATYSALGMVWALRLLDPAWRTVWGDPVLPRDSTTADDPVRKTIVLLTDGEDNHIRDADRHLQTACATAKSAGVRIFVVAAMDLSHARDAAFVRRLENCSSNAEFPDVEHVFVNNATPEALRDAFRSIARQLTKLRLVQ